MPVWIQTCVRLPVKCLTARPNWLTFSPHRMKGTDPIVMLVCVSCQDSSAIRKQTDSICVIHLLLYTTGTDKRKRTQGEAISKTSTREKVQVKKIETCWGCWTIHQRERAGEMVSNTLLPSLRSSLLVAGMPSGVGISSSYIISCTYEIASAQPPHWLIPWADVKWPIKENTKVVYLFPPVPAFSTARPSFPFP